MHSFLSGVNGLVTQDSLVGPPVSFVALGPQLADGASPVWVPSWLMVPHLSGHGALSFY